MMIFYYLVEMKNLKEKNDNYLLKNGDTLEELNNNNKNVVAVFREKLFRLLEVDLVL